MASNLGVMAKGDNPAAEIRGGRDINVATEVQESISV